MKAATGKNYCLFVVAVISIHAAREGGDAYGDETVAAGQGFQSTPPVKAATNKRYPFGRKGDISIHAAREGGDRTTYIDGWHKAISIHAAREGGDRILKVRLVQPLDFNPRRP